MSKKPPETSPSKPRTAPRSKPKAAQASTKPVAETAATTEGKVETVLSAQTVTPEQILQQLQNGQPIDSESWAKGCTVEVRDGKVFISRRSGCVTKKLVDGAPLKLPVAEPVVTDVAESAPPAGEFSQDEMAALKSVEAEAPAPVVPAAEPSTNQILEVAPITLETAREKWRRARIKLEVASEGVNLAQLKLDIAIETLGVAWKKLDVAVDRANVAWGKLDVAIEKSDAAWEKFATANNTEDIGEKTNLLNMAAELLEASIPLRKEATNLFNEATELVQTSKIVAVAPAAESVATSAPVPEQPVTPSVPSSADINTLLDDDVADIPAGEPELVSEQPAPAVTPTPAPEQPEARILEDTSTPAEAPKETFSEFADRQSKAERHAAPTYFAPGIPVSGTPTPPLGSRPVPKVEVPFLEAETKALGVSDIQAAELARIEALRGKVVNLEERFGGLKKQAQALLKGEPASSGTDILTIITVFNDLKTEITDLLNSLLADANSNKGLIGRLKQLLDKDIKGVLVDLNPKQQNGVETGFFAGRKAGSEVTATPVRVPLYVRRYKDFLLAASVLTAAGIAGMKMCAKPDSGNQSGDEQEISGTVLPPEQSTPTPTPAPVLPPPEEQPTTDLNLEPVGTAELPATTTTTFNCEIDTTTDTAQIKCVNPSTPGAEVEEKLALAGQYDGEKKTIPVKLTLVDPDGNTFEATFEAQVGTRKELNFSFSNPTLEAQQQ